MSVEMVNLPWVPLLSIDELFDSRVDAGDRSVREHASKVGQVIRAPASDFEGRRGFELYRSLIPTFPK